MTNSPNIFCRCTKFIEAIFIFLLCALVPKADSQQIVRTTNSDFKTAGINESLKKSAYKSNNASKHVLLDVKLIRTTNTIFNFGLHIHAERVS